GLDRARAWGEIVVGEAPVRGGVKVGCAQKGAVKKHLDLRDRIACRLCGAGECYVSPGNLGARCWGGDCDRRSSGCTLRLSDHPTGGHICRQTAGFAEDADNDDFITRPVSKLPKCNGGSIDDLGIYT